MSNRPLHTPRVQDNKPLELLIRKINRRPAIAAEPSRQCVAAHGIRVLVRLDNVGDGCEAYLGASEAMVVCECGAGGVLAIVAVAEDGAFVGTC